MMWLLAPFFTKLWIFFSHILILFFFSIKNVVKLLQIFKCFIYPSDDIHTSELNEASFYRSLVPSLPRMSLVVSAVCQRLWKSYQ